MRCGACKEISTVAKSAKQIVLLSIGSQILDPPQKSEWFVLVNDVTYGPYLDHEFRHHAVGSRVSPESLVRRGQDEKWFPAKNVKALQFAGQKSRMTILQWVLASIAGGGLLLICCGDAFYSEYSTDAFTHNAMLIGGGVMMLGSLVLFGVSTGRSVEQTLKTINDFNDEPHS